MEFDRFTFVLIRRGPRALEFSDEELDALQRGHLAFLGEMRGQGHLVLAGPFDGQEDETKRGFCLYRTDVAETNRLIADGDPSVRAGRIAVETMTWLTQQGTIG